MDGVEPAAWPRRIGALTLFVADLARARAFYSTVFGVPVRYEDANSAVFEFDNTLINLLVVSQAPELIAPARVAGAESGSRFQFTIWVEDLDVVRAQLAEQSVALLNGPLDRPWGQRTIAFADPDGHIWEIAQELAASSG